MTFCFTLEPGPMPAFPASCAQGCRFDVRPVFGRVPLFDLVAIAPGPRPDMPVVTTYLAQGDIDHVCAVRDTLEGANK